MEKFPFYSITLSVSALLPSSTLKTTTTQVTFDGSAMSYDVTDFENGIWNWRIRVSNGISVCLCVNFSDILLRVNIPILGHSV